MEPREAWEREGLDALADLIGNVDKKLSGEEMAKSLFDSTGALRSIYELNVEDLMMHPGMTRPVAEAIDLVDALSRYIRREEYGQKPVFTRAGAAAGYFRALMFGLHVEHCYLMCLDARGRLIRCPLLQKGTVDRSAVYMRDIALAALRCKAVYAVLAHNHPGGSTEASGADVSVTYQAMNALSVIQVIMLDHIVVTDSDFVSLRAQGALSERIWLAQSAKDKILGQWLKPEDPGKAGR